MRIFLTGGTGFIGGEVARRLIGRGEEVVALVRTPSKAVELERLGCSLVEGDLDRMSALEEGLSGADAVIHCAASYRVGMPPSEHESMRAVNVDGTRNVLGVARTAGVSKAVHVSTIAVFGNTAGEVATEEDFDPASSIHGSCYEETKAAAHEEALVQAEHGLPVVIVQPGGVYGPADQSAVGGVITKFAKRQLPAMLFPDLGLSLVHRDDVAEGILLALDRGKVGESYILGGQTETMRGLIATEARILGRRPPRLTVPSSLIRALHPIGRLVGPAIGSGPNLRELVDGAEGVTFWASSDKAVRELGYAYRPLEEGLRQTLAADGLLR